MNRKDEILILKQFPVLFETNSDWQLKTGSWHGHYSDAITSATASQITGASIVCFTVCTGAYERKHQSSASLAFVMGITGDQWIPLTKDQWRGNCFHLMTSSWATTGGTRGWRRDKLLSYPFRHIWHPLRLESCNFNEIFVNGCTGRFHC